MAPVKPHDGRSPADLFHRVQAVAYWSFKGIAVCAALGFKGSPRNCEIGHGLTLENWLGLGGWF